MCKLGVISQEWLKIDVKLLLSANRKWYMPRRLAQRRMTLGDLEWPYSGSASRAISAVAELLVLRLQEHLLKAIGRREADENVSSVAVDFVLQQYHSEVSTLTAQLRGARERQLRVLLEKLDDSKQLQQR